MVEVLYRDRAAPAEPRFFRTPRFEELAAAVCRHFGVEPAELRGRGRGRVVLKARRVLAALCRGHTELSFPEIAGLMGPPGVSHTQSIARMQRFAMDAGELGPIAWEIEDRLGLRRGGALHAAMRYLEPSRRGAGAAEAHAEEPPGRP